jgi:hypothetical protein
MSTSRYQFLFLLCLLVTLLINLAFQEQIASLISPDWIVDKSRSEHNEIENPLLPRLAELSNEEGIELIVPPITKIFAFNPPTRFSLMSMIPKDAFTNKIDVLFVGDSTLMWGFDHRQAAYNSGLRTAQISFGQNTPDNDLAAFTALLARCVVSPDGIIVLSYSRRGLAGNRPSRPVDIDVRESVQLKDCSDLDEAMNEKVNEKPNPFLDNSSYKSNFLDTLIVKTDSWIPLSSARIGWKSFFPDKHETDRSNFLVWQPGLKVVWRGDHGYWNYRQLNPKKAIKDWLEEEKSMPDDYRDAGKINMRVWNQEIVGRPVCHVLPPTSTDEDFRFGLWRDWTRSRCLLDFGTIIYNQLNIAKIKVTGRHHYMEESGLIMAASIGKLLGAERQKIIDNAEIPGTSPAKTGKRMVGKSEFQQPREVAPGIWLR